MADISSKNLPNYEVVPLRKDEITIAVAQSFIRTVDPKNPKEMMIKNTEHLCRMVDQAMGWGGTDIVVFHEFPIGGYRGYWTREECLAISIEVPGVETEMLGKKAQQHKCYISLGSYAKMADWPGHFMNMGLIIGPNGDIIYKHWKARNMAGMGFSTTVHDILDQYVERYGWDAVLPVARTDIGNIAIMPEVFEPEIARVFAMKGTEILIRYMTGGGVPIYRIELQGQCASSGMYGVFVNQAISPENAPYLEDTWAGMSAIINNEGSIIAEATGQHETIVKATIPLASYRKKHSIPAIPTDLFLKDYNSYVPKIPANCFDKSMPNSIMESFEHYGKFANW